MNQILESLEFDPKEGRLSLQAVRYLLIRPAMWVEVQKAIETHLPYDAGSLLAKAAQSEGVVLASRLREVFQYSGPDVLRSLGFLLQESGWGVVSLDMINLEMRELVFRVESSPFGEEYGPSIEPVCHLLLGIFRGAGMVLFECDVEGAEVQCTARGDNVCRFVVTAPI